MEDMHEREINSRADHISFQVNAAAPWFCVIGCMSSSVILTCYGGTGVPALGNQVVNLQRKVNFDQKTSLQGL